MANGPPVVAVTGAAGYIGSRLLQELENEEDLPRTVAIDSRPMPLPFHNVASERLDLTKPLTEVFRHHRVNTVVHLAFIPGPGRNRIEGENIRQANLKSVHNVLNACHETKVSNIIYLSSHAIYGAHKDNPVPITEAAPLRPPTEFQYTHDKALCEYAVREFGSGHPDVGVTILRSCIVMGPGADNFVTRAFFKPVLLRVLGYDPPFQFIHEDDLARVLRLLIFEPYPGIFNVAGEGTIPYSRVVRASRRKLIVLPSMMAYPLVQMAWRLGIQKEAPGSGLDFVRYPIVVSTSKLEQETGFSPSYTSEEALMAYTMGRA